MLLEFDTPREIKLKVLDQYLADGWYRMGHTIFTTDFLYHNNEFYKVIWLRYCLAIYSESKSFLKLKKLNKFFTIAITPLRATDELERLYQRYVSTMSPGRAGSLQELLFGETNHDVYESLVINLYDDGKLAGAGIFDAGEKSAAGITTFYDPAYKKYSIGRYLIYLKIIYCREQGFDYFYPGYFVPGVKAFDYKLGIGNGSIEYYDWSTKLWNPFADFRLEDQSCLL